MSNGGSLYGKSLSNEDLRASVPAIFARSAHESRSDKFVPIPTVEIINGMRKEGFQPFFAQQAKTRIVGKEMFTKHMVRFRHDSLKSGEGDAFEVILINGNDGTSSYQLMSGFFRFVCANGLFTGDKFGDVRVRHVSDAVDQVIDGSYTVLNEAPQVVEDVRRFKGIELSRDEQLIYADAAHSVRFPEAHLLDDEGEVVKKAPVDAERLLYTRRAADQDRSLWTTFNKVQENTIKGGLRGGIVGSNGRYRRQSTRAIKGIDQNSTVNKALWKMADEMAKLKEAA
jgi:hypothetical protein